MSDAWGEEGVVVSDTARVCVVFETANLCKLVL